MSKEVYRPSIKATAIALAFWGVAGTGGLLAMTSTGLACGPTIRPDADLRQVLTDWYMTGEADPDVAEWIHWRWPLIWTRNEDAGSVG